VSSPAAGRAMMERLFAEGAAGLRAHLDRLSPGMGETVEGFAFGNVYSRPGLEVKTRQLVTVVALATLGNCQPQLETHLRAALRVGWSPAELVEALTQLAIYAGFPASLNALALAQKVCGDIEPPPA
jgi:4-carboxymuconolactone decarboxylase